MSDAQQYIPPPPPPPTLPPPPAAPASSAQFDFAKPFTYVFDDPRWVQKILIGGLFQLACVVLVGVFFILGYIARTARNVIAGEATPLPEWDDLGGFFNEGVRLFAVCLAYILPIFIIFLSVLIPAGILSDIDDSGVQAIASGMAGCVVCLFVPISMMVLLFLPAALTLVIVEQRFNAAFEISRIWDFVRANIGNYLLAFVIFVIARFLSGFGMALLCIGVFFTAFWSVLITTHAFAQVYRLREP
jgi:hypothetical protein